MPQADREWWAEQRRQAAVLRQQQAANAAGQQQQAGQLAARDQYAQQVALMREQAGHRQQEQLLGLYGQAALSQQAHAQGMESATHHVDLQARLNEVQLNQAEQQRMNRLQHAIAGVEDNPDLAPSERNMLIGQLRSGLNPMENRQREQQMLQSHLQSQALSQQTDQQATLFNQRQHRLSQTAQDRTAVLTDPLTGRRQLFMMDLEGHYQPLDFSLAQQRHEMQMAQGEEGIATSQQNRAIQGAMAPGAYESQQLQNRRTELLNQQAGQAIQFAQDLHPGNVQHGQIVNSHIVQQMAHGADTHVLQQLSGYAHLDDLRLRMAQALQMNPHNVNLAEANVGLAQQNLQNLIRQNANADDIHDAQAEYQAAQLAHMRAQTTQLTQGTEDRRNIGAPFIQRLPSGGTVEGIYGRNGPEILEQSSPRINAQHITAVQSDVRREMQAERQAAHREGLSASQRRALQRPWMLEGDAEHREYEQRVQRRVEQLRHHLRREHEGGGNNPPNPQNRNAFDNAFGNAMRP